jgi:hypothetical protein
MIEVFEMLNAFNLKETKPLKVLSPEGLFSEHLVSLIYSNLFTWIIEVIDDNDPNTPKKKEEHVCNDDLVTEISSNTQ